MAHDLNPAQREAVNTLSGPLLVLAGAGTGKTRVVTYRIARLIRTKVRPDRILAVTFTKKAAMEMQERAMALLGKKRGREKPLISTFHSLCVRILRRHITALGYPQHFAIYDRGDQESTARAALREINVPNTTLKPAELVNNISRWKTASVLPPEAAAMADTDKQVLAAAAYRRYQRALKAAGAVDFDDLLLLTERLFAEFPKVRREEADRYDHLLIDEYQDTNGSQYRVVKALAERHRNLCVVGDDDQAIYGWRGAEVTHILRFQRDWPGAKVVRLEDNYRSTHEILEMANRVIAFNRHRHGKVLRAARTEGPRPRVLHFPDEITEAQSVVDEIANHITARVAQPRDFAILFRTNEQPRAFETELRRAKLPYTLIGGMSFFDRREVRDVLAYCKLLVHPRDEVSLLRILNTPARGIGTKAREQLMEFAVAKGKPLWEVLPETHRQLDLPTAASRGIASLIQVLKESCRALERRSSVDVVTDLLHELRYEDELRRNYPDAQEQAARWNAVQEVVNALAAYEQRADEPSMGDFLDDLIFSSRETEQDKESKLSANTIALMTLHGAKGLEFPRVYLVGMEEGFLPHHRSIAAEGDAIDEERRLCYVGVTRAQDELTLTMALSRRKWGKSRPTIPSRFLFELTGQADNPKAIAALEAVKATFNPRDTLPNKNRAVAGTKKPQGASGKPTRATERSRAASQASRSKASRPKATRSKKPTRPGPTRRGES